MQIVIMSTLNKKLPKVALSALTNKSCQRLTNTDRLVQHQVADLLVPVQKRYHDPLALNP